MEPVGIQRKRTKGFNLQAESRAINGLPAKYVGRSGKGRGEYGNPFKIGARFFEGEFLHQFLDGATEVTAENCLPAFEKLCRVWLDRDPTWLLRLRGYNLACWCPVGEPDDKCHRSVLLKLLKETANVQRP